MLDKLQAGHVLHLAPEVVTSDDHPLHLGTQTHASMKAAS